MSEPFIGEVRLFANSFVPKDWLPCDGRKLQIGSYTALFALLGTRFGGDGTNDFALPNLSGAVAIGVGLSAAGTKITLGETFGEAEVTLTTAEMPAHTHTLQKKVTNAPNAVAKTAGPSATSNLGGLSDAAGTTGYKSAINVNPMPDTILDPLTVGQAGNDQRHENRQPYLALYYAIACTGVFPHH